MSTAKHDVLRVPKSQKIISERMPVTAMRIGDEIHIPGERTDHTVKVTELRWTRRKTSLIVNEHDVYSRCGFYQLVRARVPRGITAEKVAP